MNYQIEQPMALMQKLAILADAAKYDVACTSSGVDRSNDGTGIGNCLKAGICHTFARRWQMYLSIENIDDQ